MNRRDMNTGPAGDGRRRSYCEVVTRTFAVPAAALPATLGSSWIEPHPRPLDLGDVGRLTLMGPLARAGPADLWRGSGRLHPRGFRLARYSRIEIEITPWSRSSCELSIRPTCRHIRRWRARRWERYFRSAVTAADVLAGAIAAPAPALVEPSLRAPAAPPVPAAA